MDLTDHEKDVLTELINIGYGRAAGALSELTGHRVTVEVPRVSLHATEEIGSILEASLSTKVTNVSQSFSGPVNGNAMLLMNEASSLLLSQILGERAPAPGDFDANAKEIIKEVGNILLNACLGVFGNLLQIRVSFSVPRIDFEHASAVMHEAGVKADAVISHGLVIHTRFHVKAADVTGFMVIALGIGSFDRLMFEVEKWEKRQLGNG